MAENWRRRLWMAPKGQSINDVLNGRSPGQIFIFQVHNTNFYCYELHTVYSVFKQSMMFDVSFYGEKMSEIKPK